MLGPSESPPIVGQRGVHAVKGRELPGGAWCSCRCRVAAAVRDAHGREGGASRSAVGHVALRPVESRIETAGKEPRTNRLVFIAFTSGTRADSAQPNLEALRRPPGTTTREPPRGGAVSLAPEVLAISDSIYRAFLPCAISGDPDDRLDLPSLPCRGQRAPGRKSRIAIRCSDCFTIASLSICVSVVPSSAPVPHLVPEETARSRASPSPPPG